MILVHITGKHFYQITLPFLATTWCVCCPFPGVPEATPARLLAAGVGVEEAGTTLLLSTALAQLFRIHYVITFNIMWCNILI